MVDLGRLLKGVGETMFGSVILSLSRYVPEEFRTVTCIPGIVVTAYGVYDVTQALGYVPEYPEVSPEELETYRRATELNLKVPKFYPGITWDDCTKFGAITDTPRVTWSYRLKEDIEPRSVYFTIVFIKVKPIEPNGFAPPDDCPGYNVSAVSLYLKKDDKYVGFPLTTDLRRCTCGIDSDIIKVYEEIDKFPCDVNTRWGDYFLLFLMNIRPLEAKEVSDFFVRVYLYGEDVIKVANEYGILKVIPTFFKWYTWY